jgi:hypothetical protein
MKRFREEVVEQRYKQSMRTRDAAPAVTEIRTLLHAPEAPLMLSPYLNFFIITLSRHVLSK